MITDLLLLKSKTVLYAEDDRTTREQTATILKMIFKDVFIAEDGKIAYEIYEDESPDLLISDIKMPNLDGLMLIKKIREQNYEMPIILITSFFEQGMLTHAANLSIDGYLLKPIELDEFIRTITKSIQRFHQQEGIITLGKNIYYNAGTQELYKEGSIISLGAREFEFLQLLIKNRFKTVTKEEISKTLWPLESVCNSSIKNLVLRIRKKLDAEIIVSVRGIGYRLQNAIE